MLLSIVVPSFNEQESLPALHARLSDALQPLGIDHELVLVDDGSSDKTLEVMRSLAAQDPRVRYCSLSRNFGHEVATSAGLERARGEAVVLMDADLQDPPELIGPMLERWRSGVDVVYAQRRRRAGESIFKKLSSWFFYRVLGRLSDVDIPRDTGDFRLMDRRVVDAVVRCRENPRFVRGLVAWAGFRQEAIAYDRDSRHGGETKYSVSKLIRLSLEAIFAFSLTPLKLTMWLGLFTILASVALTSVVVVQRLVTDTPMLQGYAFLTCGMFFLGGVQLTMLGIMSQYLGHIFTHTQSRPLYLVAEETGGVGRGRGGGLGVGAVEPKVMRSEAKTDEVMRPMRNAPLG